MDLAQLRTSVAQLIFAQAQGNGLLAVGLMLATMSLVFICILVWAVAAKRAQEEQAKKAAGEDSKKEPSV